MCSNPRETVTEDGEVIQFACRKCNDCIKARKNDWVARGMAEMLTSHETLVINLTYRNNPDGTVPDRAISFWYSDVQIFMKRLREAYFEKYEARNELRYIIAGERGSQKGRVHWHMIIYGDRPFTCLGQWKDQTNVNKIDRNRPGRMPNSDEYYRDHWQYWDHGHVTTDVGTQGSLAYVLKYALKDQFNVVQSKGTMREAKSENDGASYFRMSKNPPIGFRWLEQKCDDWERRLVVPTSLDLSVPGYSGYWYPKRDQREYLLNRLHHINEQRKELVGRECPQWDALIASVLSVEKDWEGLTYGQIEGWQEEYDEEAWQEHLGHWKAKIRKRCGHVLPCNKCQRGLTSDTRRSLAVAMEIAEAGYKQACEKGEWRSFDKWWRDTHGINYYCGLKDTEGRQAAFSPTRPKQV